MNRAELSQALEKQQKRLDLELLESYVGKDLTSKKRARESDHESSSGGEDDGGSTPPHGGVFLGGGGEVWVGGLWRGGA